jgi:single-stranded-DNA-specific exonuclease
MVKRWRIHPHDADRVAQMERAARVPPIVAQLLICRGVYDPTAARDFLDAKLTGLRDPAELPGAADAAERLHAAIQAGRRIVIYGDYDADGMTATGLLYSCLRLLGANVGYHVPNRLDDGYGLNHEALRTLASQNASLVITVDCGIASIDQAETARELGIELIVTDHHEFAERLPRAAAIVHPRLPGHSYPFGGLCGAGVAFKLAWALCQRASQAKKVSEAMRNYLLTAVGLAALGTVADVVPLLDENRILVRHGLSSLKDRPVLGLAALMKVTQLDQKPQLSSEDIAFTLAPRLNAAGRLGQAQLGVELLTTESPQRAAALAEYIHELNSSRDSLERSIYLAAAKQLKEDFDPESDPALVLAGRGWHAGVIGIVAGRLAEKYHRPVVLIALDQLGVKVGCGSARSACGLNLHEALAACTHHLVSHGGHAAAAGLKIEESNVEAFRADFCEYAASETTAADRVAELKIDVEAPLSQLTLKTVQQIEQLSPFGQSNPRPLLCSTGVELTEPPRRMGSSQRHLSLKLRQHGVTLRAVAFGQGDWADELAQLDGPIDIAYRPVINDYRGRQSVELHLVDWRAARDPVAVASANGTLTLGGTP